jgi:hypothetical protein
VLNLTRGGTNLVLGWTIPSTNFTLQCSSELKTAGWVDVTDVPVCNLTNLQYQLNILPTNTLSFYRLKKP